MAKLLRVLAITSAYPSRPGDPRGIFIHRLTTALAKEGLDVTVLAPGAPEAPLSETLDGVTVQRAQYWTSHRQALAVGVGGIVPNIRGNPLLALQLPALLMSLRHKAIRLGAGFDLIHAHWTVPAGQAGQAAARTHGLPFVVTSHGGDLNLARRVPLLSTIIRRVCNSADACIGVSQDMVNEFARYGVEPSRVHHIPYGVPENLAADESVLPPLVRHFAATPTFRVIYVGSLIPRKSVHTLLEAHALLQRRGRDISTLVVGDGLCARELRDQVKSQGLRGVTFAGSQPPEIAAACMQGAYVLVLPSRSEGRPLVLLEAMSLGVPVIATDIPGSRELARPGETGMLFPVGDSAALAKCLEALMDDRLLGHRLGVNGRAFVHNERLTDQAIAQRHVELYQRLLTVTPARQPTIR